LLNILQQELDDSELEVPIKLHIINEVGFEHGQLDMAAEGDLPLLQDTFEEMIWVEWRVTYRDVMVLDTRGHYVGTFNLTAHDLAEPVNMEALESLLFSALETTD